MKTDTSQSPAIRAEGVVVRYGELTAVDGLDLEVRRGECFGLLGPNGAGKTTTVECFEGLLRPASGTVEIFGERWGTRRDQKLRERLGVSLQETRLSENLTVFETVRLFASFYAAHRGVDEAIGLLDLQEKRDARVGKLSGGQRQRLSLACALVGRPDLLFLDEPTTGLDPQARLKIWEVVEQFTADGGTVLLTTHYMEEAARLCHRVAVVDRGKRIAMDTPEALIESLGAQEVIELEIAPEWQEALESLGGVSHSERRGDKVVLLVEHTAETLRHIIDLTKETPSALGTISTHKATLEDVFVHLTGRGLRDE